MQESERVSRAARAAIGRAKQRAAPQVTPDDLLMGLLGEVARFGVVVVGRWALDLGALEADGSAPPAAGRGAAGAGETPAPAGEDDRPAPAYAPETAELFDRAVETARQAGAARAGIVDFLAAFAEEGGRMAEVRERLGCSPTEWRAALARGELHLPPRRPGEAGTEGARGSVPTLLDVEAAGTYLSVHPQTVRNYIRSGKLPAYRLAGERVIRVLREDLLALLEPVSAEDTE